MLDWYVLIVNLPNLLVYIDSAFISSSSEVLGDWVLPMGSDNVTTTNCPICRDCFSDFVVDGIDDRFLEWKVLGYLLRGNLKNSENTLPH